MENPDRNSQEQAMCGCKLGFIVALLAMIIYLIGLQVQRLLD